MVVLLLLHLMVVLGASLLLEWVEGVQERSAAGLRKQLAYRGSWGPSST